MNRTRTVIALLVIACGPSIAAVTAKPNVVFILADDLGWSDTTLYGTTTLYQTPNIERLAKRGMTFTRAYSASPLCSPTRSAILTGLSPARTGLTAPNCHMPSVVLEATPGKSAAPEQKSVQPSPVTRLKTEYRTLAESLREAGYATGHFGKWHLGPEPYSPLEQGFDTDIPHWHGPGPAGNFVAPWRFPAFKARKPGEHIEDRMATEAVAWMEQHKDGPFFLNYWMFSVHAPFDAKQALIEKHRGRVDPKDAQRSPTYAAMVESMDDAVGTLLDALDRLKLADNTIVIFTSDNGGNMYDEVDGTTPTSNRPLRGGKATVFEGGTRVPCVVAWPGATKPGTCSDALLQSEDFYPTLLAGLGLAPAPGQRFDGVSILPALKGEPFDRGALFQCFPHNPAVPDWLPPSISVHRGDWKLIRIFHGGDNGAHRPLLFNLRDDLSETKNLAEQRPEVVAELDALITQFLSDTKAVVPVPNPAFDPAKYRPEREGVHKPKAAAQAKPALHAELPQFSVPGYEPDMKALNELHALHHDGAFTDCTLWDAWLPMATLWSSEKKRAQYRAALLNRRIDDEGYVAMQQHRGLAHSDGWPFPTYQQSGGAGWHFSLADEAYAVGIFKQKAVLSAEGWEISGAAVEGIDPARGLNLRATNDVVTVTTPAFRCGTIVAPYARIEWAAQGLSDAAQPHVCWLLEGEGEWKPERRMGFPALGDVDGLRYANVPLYRHPAYGGLLTRYRFVFDKAAGSRLTVKSVITAIDTRHPGNNADYTLGCADYFDWTCDTAFLKEVLPKLRRAMDFAIREFALREEKCVRVPWVGHDGRSGLGRDADGKHTVKLGLGVGNGYYDLVPFGGRDAYATVHYYAALLRLAALEQAAERHPEWGISPDGRKQSPDELRKIATDMRQHADTLFWRPAAGRFAGWQELSGTFYDYGFTFVNLEAVHYGLATPEQARSIFEWLDGKRAVEGDTSTGADIYTWRFGARSTTRRNTETYVWCWPRPEDIPWGGQVQDGGAVLGFSYFDLMARLKANGPDDAWRRLREILAWFREVQAEGGYRAYYAKPGRGTLQGGGPAGGLGMDQEFMESVLVPQVMLYGFLGFSPAGDTYTVKPRMPKGWPSLTVTDIRFRDQILDVTAHADGRVEVRPKEAGAAAAVQAPYADGRPRPALRLEARDEGRVLRHGDGPAQCDRYGAREASVVEHEGLYYLYYDGAGPDGWLACLATSRDLKTWTKHGAKTELGAPNEDDAGTVASPWLIRDGDFWHMFYVGCRTTTPPPDRIPATPYFTLKARAASPDGPWQKQRAVVPFRPVPGTYNADTASPGCMVKKGDEFLMFYSAATAVPKFKRTLALARTRDLDGPWQVAPEPLLPLDEQIENSSLYYEPANGTWFLFTNHIGIDDKGLEFTDAIWVYWSKDLEKWEAGNKAVVLDGRNCSWSKACIGMPTVIKSGNRLALLYDAPGGDSVSHMSRDLGLAWLELPLRPPAH